LVSISFCETADAYFSANKIDIDINNDIGIKTGIDTGIDIGTDFVRRNRRCLFLGEHENEVEKFGGKKMFRR
jgi:hypothetical protein